MAMPRRGKILPSSARAVKAGKAALFELAESSLRPIVFLDEPAALRAATEKHLAAATENYERNAQANAPTPEHYFWNEAQFASALAKTSQINLEQLALTIGETPQFELPSRPSPRFHGDVVACMAEAKSQVESGGTVFLTAASSGEIERFADICREYEAPYVLGESENAAAGFTAEGAQESARLLLIRAPFAEGVTFPSAKVTLLGNSDLFESTPAVERPSKKIRTSGFFSDFAELKSGDFIVHIDHGIGQFEGLRQIESDGRRGEFMLLRYSDDARLYVPLERMDLVQSYRVVEGAHPTLDKLGGTGWNTRKTRVRKSLEDMADQLLSLYAQRKTAEGHAFTPDGNFQREFEDAFEFEETTDQNSAIADIKRDMQSPTPMDRLLCGDVGYGKTEVAMRAAFKAVADGKQVAVLAPTTVLAFQHFETFKRRFAAFPAHHPHDEPLPHRRSAKRNPRAPRSRKSRRRHRHPSPAFQRHQVPRSRPADRRRRAAFRRRPQRAPQRDTQKRRRSRAFRHADSSYLAHVPGRLARHVSDRNAATRPPRHSNRRRALPRRSRSAAPSKTNSLAMVRSTSSTIVSSPSTRSPTLVTKLVPKARVVVGHGQMNEKELESVMYKFVRDEADVLVSTTIVENGLDIPRANTILINRADRLGLAELYQLRGRVGRSDRRAYAYLLVPPETTLSDIARKRLSAMKEFSELGAGFRIAALDLELRGAGNMLGRQQHGHIESIGFDLYCQMLERAVSKLKGEEAAPELRTTLSLGFDVRIPENYIPSENLRLRTYKRVSSITTDEEKQDVRKELEDRFGAASAVRGQPSGICRAQIHE